ncbi:MAG: hypothetical protein ACRCVW_01920 [Brevinema sp.]
MKKILSNTLLIVFITSFAFSQTDSISYSEFLSLTNNDTTNDAELIEESEIYITDEEPVCYNESAQSILEQLSSEDQIKIKDAVVAYNFDKARTLLKFRPALDQAYYKRDMAKLDLSELVTQKRDDQAYVDELQKNISIVKQMEQQIINTKSAEQIAITSLQKTLRKKISRIVNNWLIKSVRLTEDEIFDLFQAAADKFSTTTFSTNIQ